eukprot:TRINITY_DN1833_c0_g1_i2.p1 TRINITY_DN1833_c0_g1~~TRINITY_DN1833_c0_g1_i2.p1  ORF type:complete len:480 (+),score=53.85 TRINITY_DN1833_c0_g1_i2:183-1442(+)
MASVKLSTISPVLLGREGDGEQQTKLEAHSFPAIAGEGGVEADTPAQHEMDTMPRSGHPVDDNDHDQQVADSAETDGTKISDAYRLHKSLSVSSIASRTVRQISKLSQWSRFSIQFSISDADGGDAGIRAQEGRCLNAVQALKDASRGELAMQGSGMKVALVACRPIIGAIVGTALVSLSYTGIQMENPVTDPDRWGGCLLLCITFWTLTLCVFASMIFTAVFTGNYSQLVLRTFLGSLLLAAAVLGAVWVGLRVLMVHVWNLTYPLPFHGLIAGQTATFCLVAWFWFSLSSTWRIDRRFRYRLMWFLALWLSFQLSFGAYLMFNVAVLHSTQDYQWLLATVGLFLIREVSLRLSIFCILRASAQDVRAPLLAKSYVEMAHLMLVCTFLGSGTGWTTTIAMLSAGFVRSVRAGSLCTVL